jgi:hypothetical protein
MIQCIDSPVPELVTAVWPVSSKVHSEVDLYFILLARSIENQGIRFPDESAIPMASFAFQYLQSDNHDLLVGALAVATVLLHRDESIH